MVFQKTRYKKKKRVPPRVKKANSHVIERARLRYGIELNENDLAHMVKLIKAGQGICIEVKSHTRRVWLLSVNGCRELVVFYDRSRKVIETVLPKDCAEMRQYLKNNPQK